MVGVQDDLGGFDAVGPLGADGELKPGENGRLVADDDGADGQDKSHGEEERFSGGLHVGGDPGIQLAPGQSAVNRLIDISRISGNITDRTVYEVDAIQAEIGPQAECIPV